MAKVCEKCGKKIGFMGSKIGDDLHFYCKKCFKEVGEKIKNDKKIFIEKSKKLIKTPINELNLPNKKFIFYANKFYAENKGQFGKNYEFFNKMNAKNLYRIHNKYAPYDINTEVPLILYEHGMVFEAIILITNKKLYYNLAASKKGRDIGNIQNGSISLDTISQVEVKPGAVGISAEIFVNGNRLGGFDIDKKKNATILNAFLTPLATNNDELITDKEKSTQGVTASKQPEKPDVATRIKQLKELLDQGIINENEFNDKKGALLAQL